MRPPTIRPFDDRDLDPAAALLAARHRRDRVHLAVLPEAWERAEGAHRFLERAMAEAPTEGFVAEREGRPVGFILGHRALHAPNSFDAQYAPPHSGSIPNWGHAVAGEEDPLQVYAALYGALAERWAEAGFLTHRAHLVTGDPAVREAWITLGFGAVYSFAVRPTEPLDAPADGLEIREATVEDAELVEWFTDLESRFHRQSPMFWPYLADDVRPATSAFHLEILREADSPVFLAYRRGRAIGMYLHVARPGFTSPLTTPGPSVYLYQAIVEDAERGSGGGRALLAHALAWAREHGKDYLTLHFASMNPSGGPFWLGHGFQPLEQALERRLDERIAWARPRD